MYTKFCPNSFFAVSIDFSELNEIFLYKKRVKKVLKLCLSVKIYIRFHLEISLIKILLLTSFLIFLIKSN